MKADMHRETARKYIAAGKLPSEMTAARDWQTRPDPFEEHWPAIEGRLRDAPELEAKTLFELLQTQLARSGRCSPSSRSLANTREARGRPGRLATRPRSRR
jgi:hypothetical protein